MNCVLVIDRDLAVRAWLADRIEARGLVPILAGDAESLLAGRLAVEVQAALVEIDDDAGYEALRYLAVTRPGAKVAAMAAGGLKSHHRARARLLGIERILDKPLDQAELAAFLDLLKDPA